MKHLLALCLLFVSSWAVAQTGNCVIFSPDGEAFYIAIDDKFQNAEATTSLKIQNIPEGDYWVTVMFADKNKKAIKSNLLFKSGKEISFQLKEEDTVLRLIEYSNVPISQVKTVASNQVVKTYTESGVAVRGIKDAKDLPKDMVRQEQGVDNMMHGERSIDDIESKRRGTFKVSEETKTDAPTAQAAPETGTTTTAEYVKVENADGTTSIIEEKTITIKEVVTKNGQQFLKTKNNKVQTVTDFDCLPMNKDAFLSLKDKMMAASDKLATAKAAVQNQCMTPAQIKVIGDMIANPSDLNEFAIVAKDACADSKKFPFAIQEPAIVQNNPIKDEVENTDVAVNTPTETVQTEASVVVEEGKLQTKAELKAQLKAEKARLKMEKKAAKEKAKVEKKAAKAAAKEAKKQAKLNK